MGAAVGSGGKGGHGGYGGFSSMDSPPKKKSNLSSTDYNSEEAREILDGSLEKRLQKKDLARILIEGTKKVYGPEKGEQVSAEFERLEKQPVYRRNAEELTAVVERVCDQEEADVNSIDNIVNQDYQPSALKVALKGTVNLINKTRWYYPFLGMLPGKYQEKIAEKLGDDPLNYTRANIWAENILLSMAAGSIMYHRKGDVLGSINIGITFGVICYAANLPRLAYGKNNSLDRFDRAAMGSYFVIPFYYAALAVKKIVSDSYSSALAVKKIVSDSYSSAREQLKEQEAQKRIELEPPSRISIEEVQLTIEAEESEREAIELTHKKNSSLLKAKREK